MVKRGNNFARVKAGLEASRDGRFQERARLGRINNAIMTLPLAVRPWAQKLMLTTNLSGEEILEAARHVPGGEGSSAGAQLMNKGRETAEILLGKTSDPNISFDPVSPNIFVPDMDSALAKAGAEAATALKKAGYLDPALRGGLGRMA